MKSLLIKFNQIIYLRTFLQKGLCRISYELFPPNSNKTNKKTYLKKLINNLKKHKTQNHKVPAR